MALDTMDIGLFVVLNISSREQTTLSNMRRNKSIIWRNGDCATDGPWFNTFFQREPFILPHVMIVLIIMLQITHHTPS